MKIKVKELKPNPFRHLESYPIDRLKVERLSKSIKKTGFWDNIIARRNNGEIQIAYGHHRLEALKKAGEKEIDIPIKQLDDETMIRIMADENDDIYAMTPAILNETIKTVRDYLKEKNGSVGRAPIMAFLQWESDEKIMNALQALSDIEGGEVDKVAYETLPTVEQATEFRRAVKKMNIPKEKQRAMATKLVKDGVGSRDIRSEVLRTHYTKPKEKPDLLAYLYKELCPMMGKLNVRLEEIQKNKKHIIESGESYLFFVECKKLKVALEKILNIPKVSTVIKKNQLQLN